MSFSGFDADTVQFLTDLSQNNDRDWFEANRARYEAVALSPSKQFVHRVRSRLAES